MRYTIVYHNAWLLEDERGPVRVGGYTLNATRDEWREIAAAIKSKAELVKFKYARVRRWRGCCAIDNPDNPLAERPAGAPIRTMTFAEADALADEITAKLDEDPSA